jgi:hypothetical protein
VDWIEWFDRMARGHPRCDEYIGMTVAGVREQVDIVDLRVIDADEVEGRKGGRMFLTADLRSGRVNVLVQGGLVTAAAKF